MPSLATIAALRIAESTPRVSRVQLCHSKHTLTSRHQSISIGVGSTARVHRPSQVLIYTCTQHCPQVCGARRRECCSRDRSLAFSRPTIVSVSRASSPSEVMLHLLHQLQPSQPLVLQTVNTSESFATPAVLPNRSRTPPNAIMPFRSLNLCFTSSFAQTRGCRRLHTVESFDTSCPVSLFLLAPLQYPLCSFVSEHSVRHVFARAEQQTHSVHLRSLVLTSRHHHSPLHGVLHLEEILFPLQSRLISREDAHQCRVQRTTSSSPTRIVSSRQ